MYTLENMKEARRDQKGKMKDTDFTNLKIKSLEVALENLDLPTLKEIFTEMFPISKLFLKNEFIKDFVKIHYFYKRPAGETVNKFITIYQKRGFMGLRTNIEMLGRELDKDYKDTKDIEKYEDWLNTDAAKMLITTYNN